jgi:hypothetical protein
MFAAILNWSAYLNPHINPEHVFTGTQDDTRREEAGDSSACNPADVASQVQIRVAWGVKIEGLWMACLRFA